MNLEIEQALRTQNHQSFDEIQAGDLVIVGGSGTYTNYRVEKVDRVLKTQIVIGNTKYRRDDGYEIGVTRFGSSIRIGSIDRYINQLKAQKVKSMMFNIDNGVSNLYADNNNSELVNQLLDQLNQVQQTLNKLQLQKGGE